MKEHKKPDKAVKNKEISITADREEIGETLKTELNESEKEPEKQENQETEDKIKKMEAEIAEFKDHYIRTLAEFDNYRKRTEKEKAENYASGAIMAVTALLPVVDNFERAMVSPTNPEDSFYKGVCMIHKQLMQNLEGMGVTYINAVGEKFDPNLHCAVGHVEDEKYGDGEVVEELQKGYKYKDKVIRYSMVNVAN